MHALLAHLRRTMRHWGEYVTLRLAIALLQSLPPQRCEQFAEAMAVVCGRVLRLRRRVLRENFDIAFPNASRAQRLALEHQMWRHLFLMIAEIALTSRKLHQVNWRELVDNPHTEVVLSRLLSTRPTIMLSAHYGNFELGGYLLGLYGFPSHTVARTLDNPLLDKFVNEFRGSTGQHMLPKTGSRQDVERILGTGGTLALLGDQAAGDKACWVSFFGRPASTHKAVALFSLTYDAPMIVTATRRKGRMFEYEIDLLGEVDPLAADFKEGSIPLLADWYTQRLEEMISKAPAQYWWVHRRWKGTPPASVARRLTQKQAA